MESEFGPGSAAHTDLMPWARQGVLLLNTVLTVEQGAAFAHAGRGWETFTRAALEYAAAQGTGPLAAVLWGKPCLLYTSSQHCGVQSGKHPARNGQPPARWWTTGSST